MFKVKCSFIQILLGISVLIILGGCCCMKNPHLEPQPMKAKDVLRHRYNPIDLPVKVYFQTALNEETHEQNISFNLLPDEKKKLDIFISRLLENNESKATVFLEGNIDEWGSDEYNYPLGLKLTSVVTTYLEKKLNSIDVEYVQVSHGETNAKKEFIGTSSEFQINYNTYVSVSTN